MTTDLKRVEFNYNYDPAALPAAIEHMRYAAQFTDVPRLVALPSHGGTCVIVGGAASIIEPDILERLTRVACGDYNMTFALNWAHTYLINRGLVPNACVMFEIDVDPTKVLKKVHPDVFYYVCSHCHPTTWGALTDKHRVMWHCWNDAPEYVSTMSELFPDEPMIGGGTTSLLRALNIGYFLGYRDFELYGVDSSLHCGSSHVFGYPPADNGSVVEVTLGTETGEMLKSYKTLGYLVYQAEQFKDWCRENHADVTMRVIGPGLLPDIHRTLYPDQYK